VTSPFDARPLIVAVAGSNGAGKSTFFHAHLAPAALRFVNADDIARDLNLDPYAAANLASKLREELVGQGESFVFETVLSDPAGEKIALLKNAAARGYTVVMIFIGIDDAAISEQRVAMRVMQGGHDIPTSKLKTRFPRTIKNLARAIRDLPHVLGFDNSDLAQPFRKVAEFEDGKAVSMHPPIPGWFPVTKKRKR
jgi:predicted ABC-type ATPase